MDTDPAHRARVDAAAGVVGRYARAGDRTVGNTIARLISDLGLFADAIGLDFDAVLRRATHPDLHTDDGPDGPAGTRITG